MTVTIRFADTSDAPELHRVIREAFSARPAVQPPADALGDTVADVEASLDAGHGVIVERQGRAVAGLLIAVDGPCATLRRVAVAPDAAGSGIGLDMIRATLMALTDLGCTEVELAARREFPETVQWWRRAGFLQLAETPTGWVMGRSLPVAVTAPHAEAMRGLGRRLAQVLRPGDLIIANGDLGAGKTTLAQGIGEGLDVEGPVVSPTFVLSRIHASRGGGPALVHVDAYRLADAAELVDIDLQDTQAEAVTFIEWGRGIADWLSDARLEIDIQRSDDPVTDARRVYLYGIGQRWRDQLEQFRQDA